MISVQEAHEIIKASVARPQVETVRVPAAGGRVLAEDVLASFPQPRFDNSAMDGFAVRWVDTQRAGPGKPVRLILKGVISAGSSPGVEVREGECVQVMTGAPVPPGADAVVMVEHTDGFESSEEVEVYRPVTQGENVRFAGEEIKERELIIPAGRRVGASELGVLTNFGYSHVPVFHQPRIGILATGDELRSVGETLEEGLVYDANLSVLANLAERVVGAKLNLRESVGDDLSALGKSFKNGLASCDIVVSSGGVSMGRFDYVRQVLEELGVKDHFWGVAQKPGKPLFFGTFRKTLVFGLPGNPVSAFICFMEYVWPTCERWMGMSPGPKIKTILSRPFPRERAKHRFLFGQTWADEGRLLSAPTPKLGSHMLTAAAGANSILESGPGDGPLLEGEPITISFIPWETVGRAV